MLRDRTIPAPTVLGITILFVYYDIAIEASDWPHRELVKERKLFRLTS